MLAGIVRRLSRAARPLLERRCAACAAPMTPEPDQTATDGRDGLCPACAVVLARRSGGYCPRCGALAALAQGEVVPCGACLQTSRPWEQFFFHAAYQGPLRDVLLRFKNGHELPLAALLGRLLAAHPGITGAYDALVPMPLHPVRLRQRGFNQALELARPLARHHGLALRPGLLLRERNTHLQAGLSLGARKGNVRGAFVAPGTIAGQRILLVDDIATTCASLVSATQTMLHAGAARVDVAVVARTPEYAAQQLFLR